ncbi:MULTISPECIES: type IV secretion system protein [unclassified Novosphingobium]|uniref:type IV secretion system protein n=1 Tax=unclassified Novosphingobium TaxID=2644732 RepID=UPI00146B5CA6|nr:MULTISPECIES: type IV secretion system protein [unclassified Novosphingobium]NMN07547.1 conjugal transfer/entry exclusion protein [Novosphingobium sp. SG919]NMN89850.1 conjugal transfer/entry exclusion protein [Novosphingobium sp. SG916]
MKEVKMKKIAWCVALAGIVGVATPAQAQLAVIDGSNLAQAINTARNTLQQIQQAEQMFHSLNDVTNVGSIAQVLNSSVLRNALPDGIADSAALLSQDLTELGAVGQRAQGILSGKNLTLSGVNSILGDAQGRLESAAQVSARSQALAEGTVEATVQTAQGLGQLKDAIGTSSSLKESADLQARATVESAQISNQLLQLMARQEADRAAASLRSAEVYADYQRNAAAETKSGSWKPTWNGQ